MTVATEIASLVEEMMKAAIIVSPRFSDYRVYTVPNYGRQTDLERAIEEALQEKRQTGETESELAQNILNGEDIYAQAPLNEEELDELRASVAKKEGLTLDQDKIAGGIKTGVRTAQNPMATLEVLLSKLPHTALILLAVSLAPLIIDELKKPGSMLDVRFRRMMIDEFNAFLDRQDQWNAQIGLRQVYVQSHNGFLIQNGAAMSESNLKQVRENVDRKALIDWTDHAKELFE